MSVKFELSCTVASYVFRILLLVSLLFNTVVNPYSPFKFKNFVLNTSVLVTNVALWVLELADSFVLLAS